MFSRYFINILRLTPKSLNRIYNTRQITCSVVSDVGKRMFTTCYGSLCKTVELGKLQQKYHLSYTCNVCDVRSAKTISKQSYEHGVVLVQCDGCKSYHLIADNLGWFSDTKVNIEDIIKEKGGTVLKVADADEIEFIPNE